MSKFGGVDYLVVAQETGTSAGSKDTITSSAMKYVSLCNIRFDRRFSTRERETSQKSSFDLRPFKYDGLFSPWTNASLQPMTIKDKLFVFGHAARSMPI